MGNLEKNGLVVSHMNHRNNRNVSIKIQRLLSGIVLMTVLALMFTLFGWNATPMNQPTARQGVISLANWDLATDGNLKLDGDWAFYWDQLIEPGNFDQPQVHLTGHYPVPGYWIKYRGLDLPSKSQATYRLVVEDLHPESILSLRTSEIYSEYRFFVNGEEMPSPWSGGQKSTRYIKPRTHTFSSGAGTLEIVLHISNRVHVNAGIGRGLVLGTPESIQRLNVSRLTWDLVSFTICLYAGLYHLIMYWRRQSDVRLAWFSYLCITIAFRGLFSNETFMMHLFPQMPFVMGSKSVHLLIPLMVFCLLRYTYYTYQEVIPRKPVRLLEGMTMAYFVVVLLIDSYTYSILASYYFLVVVAAMFLVMYTTTHEIISGSRESVLYFISTLFLVAGVINDMLYYNKIIDTGYLFPLTLTIFITIHSSIFSMEFAGLVTDKEQAYAKLQETDLAFMQAQIKPHFIYNALSTISYLTTRNPEKAKEKLLDFSDYLRGSFRLENARGLTTLEKELALVKAYLSIEQERFGDRLQVEWQINALPDTLVPILSLQPLVENAVGHGLMEKLEGGTVIIEARQTDEGVQLIVEDDGVGMEAEQVEDLLQDRHGNGVGIKNIHNRLKLLYGQGLHIQSQPGKGTRVEIMIPPEGLAKGMQRGKR